MLDPSSFLQRGPLSAGGETQSRAASFHDDLQQLPGSSPRLPDRELTLIGNATGWSDAERRWTRLELFAQNIPRHVNPPYRERPRADQQAL